MLASLSALAMPLADDTARLDRQNRINMKHERIDVSTKFGHDERHAFGHQAGNEPDIGQR
jgi:hypothetical protein